jgi:glycosyltransferase involved in cell wall biosynthesis
MSPHWTGGMEYYRLLRAAFGVLPEAERPRTGLLTWDAEADASKRGDLADELIVIRPGSEGIAPLRRLGNRMARVGLPVPSMTTFELALNEFGADVLFGTQVFSGAGPIPFLGWIPDFQYSHLPEIYGKEGVERTHSAAHAIVEQADRLVMSSEAVKSDLARLFPNAVEKARVVHFVSPVPADAYARDPAWVCGHYHIPERFLYIPNQFWAHKNHHLVLEALQMEPARSAGVVVVCSGNAHDQRNPTYFGELLAAISASGMRERMMVLGLVPRAHVLPLMRQSVALLQPSRFEGWNTGIEEAKSLGKAVLASDLPVHREQDPPNGVYFSVNDAQDLSRRMVEVWDMRRPGPDRELEEAARGSLRDRMAFFAQRFSGVAAEAAAVRRPK